MSDLWEKYCTSAEKYCRYVGPDNFNYSVNISLKYKYMYVETPKVACSTIKTILQRMELEDPGFQRDDFEDLHNRDFSPLLRPQQVGNLDVLFERKDIFKFCFVRNPYTRLLSCYLDKIKGCKQQKVQVLRQLGSGQDDLDKEITFAEFVGAVIDQPVSCMDPHWRHQYYQTFQENIHYDFIGRFEKIDHDLIIALDKISNSYNKYFGKECRHSQQTSRQLTSYYNEQLRKQVLSKFEIDFRHFNYDENLPE